MSKYNLDISNDVFKKSLITDSRANELGLEVPSIVAVKGDALLDFILFKNQNFYFPELNTKEELNELRTNYCGNENLASTMKELGIYEEIDYGNNPSSLTDQTSATCFEALLFNIYLENGLGGVESFLESINFYTSYNKHKLLTKLSNKELFNITRTAINDINNLSCNFITESSLCFFNMYVIFNNCIIDIFKSNGGELYDDLTEMLEFIASKYSINEINGKNQKKYLGKFRFLLTRIFDIIIKINELNKNYTRIIVNDGYIHIDMEKVNEYKHNYFLEFLYQLERKLIT